jgi:MoaA/NifB/PqqE/SkfB family radical SAM enzyme
MLESLNHRKFPTLEVGNFEFISQLNIIIGDKCNAECSFCTNFSSPKGRKRLTDDDISNLIIEAKNSGIKRIGFSGGEPFLFRETLLDACKLCKELNMHFVIATNCFWAKNREKTLATLAELKKLGLVKLQISYDEEHSRFVEAARIANTLEIAKTLKISTILNSVYISGGKRLSDIIKVQNFPELVIDEQPVVNVGRALDSKIIVKSGRDANILSPTLSNCPKLLQLTVNFDGEIYPCCSVGGFSKHLSLGNIKDNKLGSAFRNMFSKVSILFLQKFDTMILANAIYAEEGKSFNSICELCHHVHSSDQRYENITEFAEREILERMLGEDRN